MNTEHDYLERIKTLEKENRALKRKLERTHTNLIRFEENNEKKEFLLRKVIQELNQTEHQLQSLVAETATATGKDFFPTLVQHLSKTLDVAVAVVSEYVEGQLWTLACWANQSLQPSLSYFPEQTPCGQALQEGMFFCDQAVQQQFPNAAVVAAMGADSYLGVALKNTQGQRIGNLCILDSKPIQNPEWAKQILSVFATRAAAELERQRAIASIEQLNQDLEERVEKRTAELEKREARYRALVNIIPDLMIRMRADGTYLDIIPSSNFNILNAEQLCCGSNVYEVSPFEHAQQRMFYAQQALESRDVQVCEYELEIDGKKQFEENRIVAINDDEVLIMVRDITERKHAEENLRQVSTRLDLALKSANIGIWEWDIVHNNLIWDDRMYELYGTPSEHFTSAYEAWITGLHPDDRPMAEEVSLQTRRGEREYDTEFRVIHPDGSIHFIKAYAVVQRDEHGEAQRMIGINYDITDRKQAEQHLQESEQKYRSLYEQASVGVVNVTLESRFLEVNPCFCNMLSYTREELLSKTVRDITHPTDRALIEPDMQRLFSGEVPCFFQEKRYLRKDGSYFWASVGVSLVKDADGNAKHTLAVIQDITSRKEAEIANQQSQQFLKTVLDTFPLNIFWKDRQSVFLGCNMNFARDAGLSTPEDIIGKTDYEMPWAETEATAFRANDRKVMETGSANLGIIETLLKADGSQIWLETNKIPLYNLEGEVIGVLGTYQDITDRKHAEFQINSLFNRTQLLNYISAEIRESLDLEIILQ
ncbi:MAG: PAS domain S-box protein, partial [Leptolyngbyaceae bacterium]|nr:PAS domain S-box protein [Leptolyngbyaceae bacterium]